VATACMLCYPLGMTAGMVTMFPLAAIGAFPR
jgi:hypothetical protein